MDGDIEFVALVFVGAALAILAMGLWGSSLEGDL